MASSLNQAGSRNAVSPVSDNASDLSLWNVGIDGLNEEDKAELVFDEMTQDNLRVVTDMQDLTAKAVETSTVKQ